MAECWFATARSTVSGRAHKTEREHPTPKLSMLVGALFFRDLSMHILTWFLPEIASTISNGAHAAKLMSRSQRPGAVFGQLWKKRAQPAAKSFSPEHGNTQNGFCVPEPRRSKQNLVTG